MDKDKALLEQIHPQATWLEVSMTLSDQVAVIRSVTTAATVIDGPVNTFLLVCELDSNDGTSITNCAETLYPELISQLELDTERLVVIEVYPPQPKSGVLDPTFDQVFLPSNTDDSMNWGPLPWDLARELNSLGVNLTSITGQWVNAVGVDPDGNSRKRTGVVVGYNGRSYRLTDDPTTPAMPPISVIQGVNNKNGIA